MTPGEDALRTFKRDLAIRRAFLLTMFSIPLVVAAIFLGVPHGPNSLAWPWILVWLVPVALLAMIIWALRDLARTNDFWLSLRPRLADARYYPRSIGVAAVFDNHLVLAEWLGLRFHLFFDETLQTLPPSPGRVAAWFWRGQRIRARASEFQGQGSIPEELRRIREILGGREPGPLAAKIELLFTERTKPVPEWPDVRYAISLGVAIPRGSKRPETFLAELDDIARFLSEAARTLGQLSLHSASVPLRPGRS